MIGKRRGGDVMRPVQNKPRPRPPPEPLLIRDMGHDIFFRVTKHDFQTRVFQLEVFFERSP